MNNCCLSQKSLPIVHRIVDSCLQRSLHLNVYNIAVFKHLKNYIGSLGTSLCWQVLSFENRSTLLGSFYSYDYAVSIYYDCNLILPFDWLLQQKTVILQGQPWTCSKYAIAHELNTSYRMLQLRSIEWCLEFHN